LYDARSLRERSDYTQLSHRGAQLVSSA